MLERVLQLFAIEILNIFIKLSLMRITRLSFLELDLMPCLFLIHNLFNEKNNVSTSIRLMFILRETYLFNTITTYFLTLFPEFFFIILINVCDLFSYF